MRLIFSILAGIVVVVAGLVFVGPMFISTEELRNQLFARVESMTGYRLRVSGPVDITLFPSIDLVAEDVGVAEPGASGDAEFATAKKLRFSLMLRGLLEGKVRVKSITLVDPVIAVPQPAQAAAAAVPPGAASPAPPGQGQAGPAPEAGGGGLAGVAQQLKTVTLDRVVIDNGTVILPPSDGAPGKRIEQLDLEASLPAFDAPLSFETSAVFDGKAIEAEGAVGSFGRFLEGAQVPVQLTVDAPGTLDAPASLSGTAAFTDETLTLSQFSAKSGDKTLTGSAVYTDGTATVSQFTGTVGSDTFAGHATYKDDVVTVKSLRANIRGTVLAGSLTANLADRVPYVVAAFAAKTLDVNALTGAPKPARSGGGGSSAGGGGSSAGGGGSSAGGSNQSGNQAGWSNTPIDFSPLKRVNGKFSLTAEQLIYDHVTLAPVSAQATLNGGKLNATLSNFNLYGGSGNVAVAVDASGKTPALRTTIEVAQFDGHSLLKDAAGFDRIEGRGTIKLDLTGVGASQRAIVSTLNGTSSVAFADGAIRGVNIAQMIRNLGSGVIQSWQGGQAEKTDFASLGASFQVANGQATTNDLHLIGPLVTVKGAGNVNLPAQSLEFRVDPQLVASLEGQGRQQDLAGLGVPVMIVGPWSKPKIYPDIKGILQDPAAALARYKQFGEQFKNLPGLGGEAGALQNVIEDGKIDQDALIQGIGGLLGGSQAPQEPSAAAAPDGAAAAPGTQAAPAPPLSNVIKDGRIDQDALIQGIGGLLGGSQAAPPPQEAVPQAAPAPQEALPPDAAPQAAAPAPAAQQAPPPETTAPPQQRKLDAEEVGRQLLDNFFGR